MSTEKTETQIAIDIRALVKQLNDVIDAASTYSLEVELDVEGALNASGRRTTLLCVRRIVRRL